MHNEYMKIARKLVKTANAFAEAQKEKEEFMKDKSQEDLDIINEKVAKKIEDLEPEYQEATKIIKKYI